mmetsp:Transcript_18464/g.28138  ORF Transcript_18464/g.28138 Transcript_18464/m.28138 type:complete len:96 (+) Transcript_18464:52-339(+)
MNLPYKQSMKKQCFVVTITTATTTTIATTAYILAVHQRITLSLELPIAGEYNKSSSAGPTCNHSSTRITAAELVSFLHHFYLSILNSQINNEQNQ